MADQAKFAALRAADYAKEQAHRDAADLAAKAIAAAKVVEAGKNWLEHKPFGLFQAENRLIYDDLCGFSAVFELEKRSFAGFRVIFVTLLSFEVVIWKKSHLRRLARLKCSSPSRPCRRSGT